MTVNATILLSGGIDSAVCMHMLGRDGYDLMPIYIDFGQAAAAQEWPSVQKLSVYFGCKPIKINLRAGRPFGSGEIRGRNAFLISTALMLSPSPSGLIVIGIHAGTTYYDCSPAFFDRMAALTGENSDGKFALAAPLLRWTKSEVYSYFRDTGIDRNFTYSCETGHPTSCGTCLSCLDRKML